MKLLSSLQALLATGSAETMPKPDHGRAVTTGCGKKHDTGYHGGNDTSFNIVSGGYTRYYAINIPSCYDPDTPSPLIMDFHGSDGTSEEQYMNSQYYLNPAGNQYLTVYPQGLKKHWQGPTYAVKGVNDTQFVTDLLAHLRQDYCIDSNRVYASGKSNGGGFVDTLACSDNGGEFAAFAMASAALYTDNGLGNCTKKRAILESHGDKDTTVPYFGNKTAHGGSEPNIKSWVHWWGERDCGKDAVANTTGDLGGYNITSYSCNGWSNVVQHYHLSNLGHCWPSSTGENWDALHEPKHQHCATDLVLDFTSVVLDWFSNWTLDTAPKSGLFGT